MPAGARATLLAACLLAACGRERPPWNGFALFPDAGTTPREAPPPTPATTATPMAELVDASTSSQAGSPAAPVAPTIDRTTTAPSAYRVTELALRDPHLFVGANDITERSLLGTSLNHDIIADQLKADENKDGLLDYSVVLLLAPDDPTAPAAVLQMLRADCPKAGSGACKATAGQQPLASFTLASRSTSASCLTPIPGSTSGYQPTISEPQAPCFVSQTAPDMRVDLGGVALDIGAARVGATYGGTLRGLIFGFVTQQAAMRAILPRDTAGLLAGTPLSRYVRRQDYDLATSPNMQDGFWLYLEFVAERVEFAP